MSTEQNKALCRRILLEAIGQGSANLIDEFLAPDFVEHEELPPGIPPGREGVKAFAKMIRSAFPDLQVKIDDMVAEGDKVIVRSTWSGTHKGAFVGVPPTGKSVSFGVYDTLRIADGKVKEHWGLTDNMRMMQQLGVVPMPG